MLGGDQLLARLGLDTSGFKAGLKDAHSAFSQLAGKIGVGLSVAGIAQYSREITEYGARVFDLGKRYEVSTDDIQKFGNAAEQNGSSLEGVARGFNKLDIAISRALGGNESILKSFASLGVTVADLKQLSPEEIMKKLGSSSLNAADMVKVLGKSALELRPVLQGIADGSIELGDAIDEGQIKKLKEADKAWKHYFETIRIWSAGFLVDLKGNTSEAVGSITGYFKNMRIELAAEFKALKAAATGDFTEMKRQGEIAAKAIKEGFGSVLSTPPWTAAAGVNDAADKFHPAKTPFVGDIPKSHSELEKEKKDRERDQLSLKELQTEGPANFRANATPQMMFAAQQARLVEQLEAQAKQVRLTGISATGETSAGLLGRADAIRQTLPIKETEKEVGIYRDALKGALSGVEEKLDLIHDELE